MITNKIHATCLKLEVIENAYAMNDNNSKKQNKEFLLQTIREIKIDSYNRLPTLMKYIKRFKLIKSIDIRDSIINNVCTFIDRLEEAFPDQGLILKAESIQYLLKKC